MANDKKFIVKNGLQSSNVNFIDSNGNNVIVAEMLTSDTLSFSGNTGQLFSITDSMTGTIFSVNDISGVPSIEVIDTGVVKIAEFTGNVLIGSNTDSVGKLQVTGNVHATGFVGSGTGLTQLNANNINTGTVGTARLGSGTANTTTWLRGDGSWQVGPLGYTGSVGFVGSKGDIGFTGSKGDIGFTGSTGFVGSQGIQGVTGFTGSKGDTGFTGSAGFTGSQGAQGITGFTGSVGFVGSKGDIGFTGSQGGQGATGFTGSVGFVGSQGSQGVTGFTGSVGFVGSASTVAGPTGFTGSAGFVGSQGSTGATGFTGSVGFVGSVGSTGFTGSVGSTGFTGSSGASILGTNNTWTGTNQFNNTVTMGNGNNIEFKGVAAGTSTQSLKFFNNSSVQRFEVGFYQDTQNLYINRSNTSGAYVDTPFSVPASGGGDPNVRGNLIWHAGNDGSGSGLDADLLDGYNIGTSGGAVPLLNGTNTWSGTQTFTSTSGVLLNPASGDSLIDGSVNGTRWFKLGYISSSLRLLAYNSGTFVGTALDIAPATMNATFGGALEVTGALTKSGNAVWHAGNDGSGSGLDADLLDGVDSATISASLRANRNISGGGTITVSSGGYVKWSSRFIVICNGRGSYFSTTGYYDIECPTSGTITGVGGASNVTATADGIVVGSWQALYYILPIGSGNASSSANFRLCSYTSDITVPHNWVLICVRNSDNEVYYFNNGVRLEPGQSFNMAVSTAEYWHAGNDGAGSGLDADLLDGYNIGTSGGAVPLLNGNNIWSGSQIFRNSNSNYTAIESTTNSSQTGLQIATRDSGGTQKNVYLYSSSGGDLVQYNAAGTFGPIWWSGNDGSGSGLDADLLDSVDSSKFVYDKGEQIGTTTDWDTFTSPGMYGVASGTAFTGNNNPGTVYTYGHMVVTEVDTKGIQQTYYPHTGNKILVRTGWNNGGWYPWQQIWTSTSDGSGSGLDADLLDGYHVGTSGATIPLLNGTNTWSALQTFSVGAPTTEAIRISNTTDGQRLHLRPARVSSENSILYLNSADGYAIELQSIGTTYWTFDENGTATWLRMNNRVDSTNGGAYLDFRTAAGAQYMVFGNRSVIVGGTYDSTPTMYSATHGTLYWFNGNQPFWHGGNDGSGSGLDADLLDGNQGSSFVQLTAPNTWNTYWYGGGDYATNILGVGNDFNNFVAQGSYHVNDTASNHPASGNYGYLRIWRVQGSKYLLQEFTTSGSPASTWRRLGYDNAGAQAWTGWNKYWSDGNDGSGSGLDADLLDGYNIGTSGGAVPLLNGSNTWSAQQAFNSSIRLNNVDVITYDGANNAKWSYGRGSGGIGEAFGFYSYTLSAVTLSGNASTGIWSFPYGITYTGSSTNIALDLATNDGYASMRVIRNNKASSDGMYIGYINTNSGETRIYGGGAGTNPLTKFSNRTEESVDFRAPIFYDNNNTSYYIDPASTSNINVLNGNGKQVLNTGDTYLRINEGGAFTAGTWFGGVLIRGDGISAGSNGGTTNSRVHINGGSYNNTNVISIDGSNGLVDATGFRIKSDTNNRFEAGTLVLRNTSPTIYFQDTDHNSAMLHCNANLLYVLRGATDSTGWTQVNGQWPFIFNLTNNDATCGGILTAITDMRAPTYYDSNNTAYYIDGNNTSVLNGLTLGSLLTGRSSASTDVNSANDSGSFSARGSSTTVASMSFHRTGAYAINMGLGTDNVFRLGGWSASSNCFQIDGSGNFTALGNVTAYSDRRYKKDISTITNALDIVQKLRGVRYTRIDTEKQGIGVIAQEVLEVLPEVVQTGIGDDTSMSVAYGNMVGLLIEAIKEQQAHINKLEQMIKEKL